MQQEEPKQETLEEASKDYIENTMKFSFNSLDTKTQANRMLKCAEFGAKWQEQRMYSELELFINEVKDKIDSFEYSVNQQSYISEYMTEWFE